jgi:DNA modification methylase
MIINGDALEILKRLEDNSVHMGVTSPPYYSPGEGLRDYETEPITWTDGWTGELGSEPTPQGYVTHLSQVCNEFKRVLRPEGSLLLNLGDSRAGSGRGPSGKNAAIKNQEERQGYSGTHQKIPPGFKRKDVFGIPFRVGISLQEDGWYWRDTIPWLKHNGMPGSYKDRPVSNLEWILVLTKSSKNYYDYVAVMQKSSESYNKDKRPRGVLRQRVNPNTKYDRDESQFKKQDNVGNPTYTGFNARWAENGGGDKRLLRSSDFFFQSFQGLWLDEEGEPMALIANPKSYGGKHYASFPVLLPEILIRGFTSDHGVCLKCGTPWIREVEKESFINRPTVGSDDQKHKVEPGLAGGLERTGGHVGCEIITTGWKPGCNCDASISPALVVDFFAGSSATGVACKKSGRNYLGIELNPEYVEMGYERIKAGK